MKMAFNMMAYTYSFGLAVTSLLLPQNPYSHDERNNSKCSGNRVVVVAIHWHRHKRTTYEYSKNAGLALLHIHVVVHAVLHMPLLVYEDYLMWNCIRDSPISFHLLFIAIISVYI